MLNPSKWLLIRGNHETREVNGNVAHYGAGSFLSQVPPPSSSSLLLSSLELSDTTIYGLYIRALLGTASNYCTVEFQEQFLRSCVTLRGRGFRIESFKFRAQGSGFEVSSLGFKV